MQLGTRGPITIAGVALSAGLVLVLVLLFKQGSAGVATAAATVACTITGTDGNDVLKGTVAPDVICGGAGNDVLIGRPGDDMLVGGQAKIPSPFALRLRPSPRPSPPRAVTETISSAESRTSSDPVTAITCPATTEEIASLEALESMSFGVRVGRIPC